MFKRNFLGLFVLLYSLVVTAQEDSTAQQLEEVIITTQRKAQKNLWVPYSTQTVQQTYISNFNPRTTPEALMGVNGVFVQKTNHGGGSPFLRGLTGNQTLILIDGIRLNNSTFRYGPNQYLNTIDPFTINKIEVAKGTGSVQYGSDALGGVVHILTKEPQFSKSTPQWSGKAFGKYMTGDMEKSIRGEGGYATKNKAIQIGVTYRNFGDLIGGDTTGWQSPSGYKELAFDAKLKFLLSPNAEFTLAHQFLQQKHVPVYHKVVLENFAFNEFHPQQRLLNYAKLNLIPKRAWLNKIEMIASWQQSMEGRNSRKNGSSTLRKERDEINTLAFTTDVAAQFSSFWTANSGVELYMDKVYSSRQDINTQTKVSTLSRGLYPDGARYGNYSIYSLHHFNFNKWVVESGIRYNTFNIRIHDTTLGNVKINPAAFVYNAALLYKVTHQQSLFISYNTGYRAPNVDDMGTLGIVDFRYEVPTSNLAAEKSKNIEVGYKVQAQKWSAALSTYYLRLNNLITRVKDEGRVISGYPVYRKENVEGAFIRGVEAQLNVEPLDGWYISGNVAYTYGQNISKNEPMRRIPPVNGKIFSKYQRNKWMGGAEMLFAAAQRRLAGGDKEDNRIPVGGTLGWKIFNIYGGYEFANLKVNLGLQNLLHEDYRTHGSGINGVGRSAWLAVAVSL